MKAALSILLVFALACYVTAQEKPKCTLEKILDSPKIHSVEIDEDSFAESWYTLYVILREGIATKEIACAIPIAKDLRFLTSTDREGRRSTKSESATLRSILYDFATAWEVSILIDGNTVYIVDEGDEARFPHSVAIGKKHKKP